MIIYAENDQYICALLEMDEFDVFARVQNACHADLQPHEVEPEYKEKVAAAIKQEGDEYWRDLFMDLRSYEFVLLEKRPQNDSVPYAIAGKTAVSLEYYEDEEEAIATFQNTHILASYRGQGLSSLLYEARLNLMAENPLILSAGLMIEPWNTPSLRAAHKAKFNVISKLNRERDVYLLNRDLDDLADKEKPGRSHIDTPGFD